MSVRQVNTRLTQADLDTLYDIFLKLDQTTPQEVNNGAPTFNGGTTDAIIIAAGKRLVFDG